MCRRRIEELFETLWELMPSLHELLQVDRKIVINQIEAKLYLEVWLLTGYFRCMLWCVRGQTQIDSFVRNFGAFRGLYLALEATRNEADLNRKVRVWRACMCACACVCVCRLLMAVNLRRS